MVSLETQSILFVNIGNRRLGQECCNLFYPKQSEWISVVIDVCQSEKLACFVFGFIFLTNQGNKRMRAKCWWRWPAEEYANVQTEEKCSSFFLCQLSDHTRRLVRPCQSWQNLLRCFGFVFFCPNVGTSRLVWDAVSPLASGQSKRGLSSPDLPVWLESQLPPLSQEYTEGSPVMLCLKIEAD